MVKFLSFILGLTSVLGQIVLLRELITVFYGNETAYAVILAGWLFWVAAGSFSVSFCSRTIKDPSRFITAFLYLISFSLPLTVFAARGIKWVMHIQTGEMIGIIPMCLASFLLLAPLTFLLGGLFALICVLNERRRDGEGQVKGISTIYLFESAGAAAGGLLFSFVLVHILPAMHASLLVGAVNIGVAVSLFHKKGRSRRAGVILILVIAMALSGGMVNRLDRFSRKIQWKNFEVVTTADSIYGNITLTKEGDVYSFFENGIHSSTTQDDLTSEESAHFPLLEHPRPRDVLLIGNGITGSLREILKHRPARVDYVELDPKIIEIAQRHLPEEYLVPLKDQRVRVIHTDARMFVKRAGRKYDAVIVNLSDPYTALINRYYSLEFFREVNRILDPGGLLALSVSSSENYLNDETRDFLRSINSTLRRVFKDVKSIPGDTNIFLASNEANALSLDAGQLVRRLQERRIEAKFVREYYLPFRLSADRMFYIEDILKKDGALNTDMHPIAYLYDIILWSTHFNTLFKNMIAKVRWITPYHLTAIPVLVLIGGLVLRKRRPALPVTLSIATTGFSEIIFQVIVIIAFQTLYGYAYYKIGLIVASFMGGLVLGSLTAKRIMGRPRETILKKYKQAQLGICLYPLILPAVFVVLRDTAPAPEMTAVFATTFAALPVIAGFIGGLQFPLAVELVHSFQPEGRGKAARQAGFLYAVDMLGATVGALTAAGLLIPLLGITAVAVLCAALNGAALLLLLSPLYPARWSEDV